MSLAENVRILRERAGMTQAELAEKLGKGQATIYKIENGLTVRPRFMDELAQALGVTRIQLEFGALSDSPAQQPREEDNIPALVTPVTQGVGYGDVPTPLHKPEAILAAPDTIAPGAATARCHLMSSAIFASKKKLHSGAVMAA